MIKSRIKWAGHVASMAGTRGAQRVLAGRPEGRDHLEDLSVDGRITLKWIFKKWDWVAWTGRGVLRMR